MDSCLSAAKNNLRIQAVNLKYSEVYVRDDLDLLPMDRAGTGSQSYRAVDRVREIALAVPETEDGVWDYRFIYSIGVRLIYLSEKHESTKEEYKPIIEIVGEFEARYLSERKLNKDEIDAFAEDNVGYHVWPYWREYVQSTCARIGFSPAFEVPVYIVPSKEGERVDGEKE